MRTLIYIFMSFLSISIVGQVGINTQIPEATFDVVGKPNDLKHFDGIIPPRITGNQLLAKSYSLSKKGTIVFVTVAPSNSIGQVANVAEPGMYYFDGSLWQPFAKERDPIEYHILLTLDPLSTSALTATSNWSAAVNKWGNNNAYLTSSKYYTIGTQNFGGLKGYISFRKINGIVNVHFQIYRSYDSSPITGNAFMNIAQIYTDIGYIPNQIVLLHTENSSEYFPALLENYAIQIPKNTLNGMSTVYYTYGEIQGFSNWRRPYLP